MANRVRVLYDFAAEPGSGELNITANEILSVTRQDVGDGWWEGVNSQGLVGLFPAGYVEAITSPPPPSIPPPPLPDDFAPALPSAHPVPPQQQTYDAGDDWDDDWDDDDEDRQGSYSSAPATVINDDHNKQGGDASGKGTVRRNFNRFSTFVKSGGENFILGRTKLAVPSDSYIHILDDGTNVMWEANPSAYTCSIDEYKKESKLKGLKSFIAYQITPSFSGQQVSRRYKQFDWLQQRLEEKYTLIPVPPLPGKQISGRYHDEFISHRMAQLRFWLNRICRHPVLSRSEVWLHFLSCNDAKRWKAGKRKAEKDELVGGAFYYTIKPPEAPLDNANLDAQLETFGKFHSKLDESVRHLYSLSVDQTKKFIGPYKRDMQKLGGSFKDLGAALDMETSSAMPGLPGALKHTGETYEEMGKMMEEQPKYDLEILECILHEYKGILSAWPDILQVNRNATVKKREFKKLVEEGKFSADAGSNICQRTDIISYATLAEINNFQQEKSVDFKYMMQVFLGGQIQFYQKIVEKLQEALVQYETV